MAHPALERAAALGAVHESSLPPEDRRRGAHYTPPDVAESLVAMALGEWSSTGTPLIVDPACGAGVFLVAAAQALLDAGVPPVAALEAVRGGDVDPGAVVAARAVLGEWAARHGVGEVPPDAVVVADGLAAGPAGRWDVVVGNPPFQNQLGRLTARDQAARGEIARRFGRIGRGYVDTAGLFLARAVERSGPGGVVAMVQPRSVLAASAAEPLRLHLGRHAPPAAVWVPGERLFDAAVEVVAVVLAVGAPERPVAVHVGRPPRGAPTVVAGAWLAGGSWAPLLAAAGSVPEPPSGLDGPALAEIAWATAGFRDQYYGLVDHTVEDGASLRRPGRLVTVGAVDPGRITWGARSVRFARRRWERPQVDLDGVAGDDPALAAWFERLAVPKVLVASQTRVVEAAVDERGDVVPVTPLVSVVAPAHDPWLVAAALTAPPVAALAHWRLAGTGMGSGTLRLGASTVLELPLPTRELEWHEAAVRLAAGPRDAAEWIALAELLCRAHGVDDPALVAWWWDAARRAIQIDGPGAQVVT